MYPHFLPRRSSPDPVFIARHFFGGGGAKEVIRLFSEQIFADPPRKWQTDTERERAASKQAAEAEAQH